MRVLITGICGFVGSKLAAKLGQDSLVSDIVGIDNLTRPGSWTNVKSLRSEGIEVIHGDVRLESDIRKAGKVDWIIDAAATPSVLSGVNATTSSRQLIETNLLGTVNLLEYCKETNAGLVLLSTSRVYSIPALANLPMRSAATRFELADLSSETLSLEHISASGIREHFSVQPPISLYGSTKLSSESLAQEYADAFDIPVWINRCGVMAGAGQFGRPDQGIFAFWLHSWKEKSPLRYIGFDGKGRQVRDCLHPNDLALLISKQIRETTLGKKSRVINVSGGKDSARSLAELSEWCRNRWDDHEIGSDNTPRDYDLPWIVLDSALALEHWQWKPQFETDQILSEIADFADAHPDWLSVSNAL